MVTRRWLPKINDKNDVKIEKKSFVIVFSDFFFSESVCKRKIVPVKRYKNDFFNGIQNPFAKK